MDNKQYTVAIVKWNVVKKIPKYTQQDFGVKLTIVKVSPNIPWWIELYAGLHPPLQDFKIEYSIGKHVTDRDWWAEFYVEHKGKEYLEPLIDYMTTDVCQFFILSSPQDNVIKRWRDLIGPTNAAMTKEPPTCLRANYGDNDALRSNGFHGSDSIEAAQREAELVKKL